MCIHHRAWSSSRNRSLRGKYCYLNSLGKSDAKGYVGNYMVVSHALLVYNLYYQFIGNGFSWSHDAVPLLECTNNALSNRIVTCFSWYHRIIALPYAYVINIFHATYIAWSLINLILTFYLFFIVNLYNEIRYPSCCFTCCCISILTIAHHGC